jgi:8-oxo-dGTP diphosphatase
MTEHDVVGAVLVDRSRVLLCHRRPDRAWYPDVWDLPGGHLEPGESSLAALGRECREELGIDVLESEVMDHVTDGEVTPVGVPRQQVVGRTGQLRARRT